MTLSSITSNHLLMFGKSISKLCVVTLLFVAPMAKAARANSCPDSSENALWLQAACDLAKDKTEVLDKIDIINENFGNFPEKFRHTIAAMSLAEAVTFAPGASPQDWMFQTTSLFTMGERSGLLRPYFPRSKKENVAEAALIHALSQPGKPELSQIIAFVQMMVENRGGRLLIGMDDTGTLYPFVASAQIHCRWADVRLTEFDILGSLNRLSDEGKAVGVAWEDVPRDCSGMES